MEKTHRITADWDNTTRWGSLYLIVKRLLKRYYNVHLVVEKSKRGYHIIITLPVPIAWQRCLELRGMLGDDPKRVDIDQLKRVGDYPARKQVLFTRKRGNEVVTLFSGVVTVQNWVETWKKIVKKAKGGADGDKAKVG